ncbi:MAG: hypothetical protein V3R81_10595 [Gammaproteobacteria bacterium]
MIGNDPLNEAWLGQELVSRGITAQSLGIAYLGFLASFILTAIVFVTLRAKLVTSPNRSSRDYGLYTAVLLITLLVAMVLENEILPGASESLPYVALPQLLLIFLIHLLIYYRQEPWIIGLGVASLSATTVLVSIILYSTQLIRPVHWLILPLAAGLLFFAWLRCISTKRAFLKSDTIYVDSKEFQEGILAGQTPWLGLPQWVALVSASLSLAVLNEILRGAALEQIPAMEILARSFFLLSITALVSAIPAATYWLARHAWMPQLTRFVWVVWLVVGFAFTYGNYLVSLDVS